MGLFFYRMMGAAMLDASMYEGIEADRTVGWQAAIVVVLSSIAAGIGAGGAYGVSWQVLLLSTVVALITWIAWAVLMFEIGTRLLPTAATSATLGELLRTIGFAASPGLLQLFAAFPVVTTPVFLVSWVWMFVAMVVAVRHALDYQSNARALAVCGLATALVLGLALVIGLLWTPAVS